MGPPRWPSVRCRRRSHLRAICSSWVTRIRAAPLVSRSRKSRSLTRLPVALSRFPVGSSANSTRGRGAKARAILRGQYHVSTDDIRAVAHPALRHRVITNFSAEAEGYTTDKLIDELLAQTPPNESPLSKDGRVNKVLAS